MARRASLLTTIRNLKAIVTKEIDSGTSLSPNSNHLSESESESKNKPTGNGDGIPITNTTVTDTIVVPKNWQEVLIPLPRSDRTLTNCSTLPDSQSFLSIDEVLPPQEDDNHEVHNEGKQEAHRESKQEARSLEEYSRYLREKYPERFAQLKQDPSLPYDQATATCEAVWRLCELPQNHVFGGSFQVIAPTGSGKTYFIKQVIGICRSENPEKFPLGKFILIISPPAVQGQTQEVLALNGADLVGCIITTLAALRCGGVGAMLIEWKTEIINHEPKLMPHWRPDLVAAIFVDESQQLKNESIQSDMILMAARYGIPIIPLSATPYSRPCQARTIGCVIAPVVELGALKVPTPLREDNWASWIGRICGKYSPLEWCPSTLEEMQRWFESKTVRFTCKYPYSVITRYVATQFTSRESRDRYNRAMQEWDEIKIAFGKDPTVGFARVLVAIGKKNQVADEERAPNTVEYAVNDYKEREGNRRKRPMSYILGFAYRTALDRALKHMIEVCGIPENKISVIAGGRGNANTRDHRLFQRDKNHFCLMTVACGGAGLSMDHNKRNSRQRVMLASIVYNDIQVAQLAGRTQRVDTQSHSYLMLLYYEGTEEHKKIVKVRRKISSLAKVITKTGVKQAREKRANVFVDDQDMIEDISIRNLLNASGADHLTDEEKEANEEAIAQQILGTQQEIEFVNEDELDNNGEDEQD